MHFVLLFNVSVIDTALPTWTAIPRRCRRCTWARLSPVFVAILEAISLMNSLDAGPKPPRVSQDTGQKVKPFSAVRSWYFFALRPSRCVAIDAPWLQAR